MNAQLQPAIIQECTNHKTANWRKADYRACITLGTDYFIKFGDPKTMAPEVATQMHIQAYAASDTAGSAPRVAKVLFHFQEQLTMYVVMEYIELVSYADSGRKANALAWLSKVAPPHGHVLGAVGGRIRHSVFKAGKAPLDFTDLAALERYLEHGRNILSINGRNTVASVNITNDRVMFLQSDLDKSNFGIDKDGKTVLMDFESIGLLPETLVLYTLSSDEIIGPFLTNTLGLSGTANLASLNAIASCLWMSSNPKLGESISCQEVV
ncbi:uncharacterized protein LACBIDRAFT_318417 [Laccaria bicolor S238N-H82]|uniref:Predicted protein n=1 Tax=Laccaria bicolor (strain S238N-H82 / ATCC MYA-4686) TaxID=486041 RepID=B0E2G9_LACBS|nr:uncharacterized protein LACBIDRAFT_318417 [Laccaria bicolor S238N-H82]EDQ98976.1 predicted protein [Laccaria bicolor S238N-H82]|eukprot:XP_001890378.1 predicted protein [Laccaria bicolor S238N-H82]